MPKCSQCKSNAVDKEGDICTSCGIKRLIQIAKGITKIPHNGQNPKQQGRGKK